MALVPILPLLLHPGAPRADWLADLEGYAVQEMTAQGVPGLAMAVVQDGQLVYAKGFGAVSNGPAAAPVDADTLFHIGSCSKAFVATQMGMLVDEARLAWTDPPARYLPAFGMYDPWVNANFQAGDLLNHRTGLREQSLSSMILLGFPTAATVGAIRHEKPLTSFRTAYAYQNDMYMAASALVAAINGRSWAEDLAARLFTPLGMRRSVTTQAAMNAKGNAALGHTIAPDGSLDVLPADWGNNFIFDLGQGAGSIRSSANDMARWLRFNLGLGAIDGQRLIGKDTLRALLAPKTVISPWTESLDGKYAGPFLYASGWGYLGYTPRPFYYHGGGDVGFTSSVGLVFGNDDGLGSGGIVVLTNVGSDYFKTEATTAKSQVSLRIAVKFYDLFVNRTVPAEDFESNIRRLGEVTAPAPAASVVPPPRAQPAATRAPERYVGAYVHPAYGLFAVEMADGGLSVVMGPRRMRASLVPTGEADAFVALLPGYPENFPMFLPVRFADMDTASPKLLLENYEQFVRVAPSVPATTLLLEDG
ncbi:MAG: serine hydrolase [Solidesulfovibrio sp. DCME]|uniref:serine hydrolase n=1 Tax=Solidesulfovibrio sp. DCME TaxID=3447380 RepID=UPI003D0A5490